MNSVGKYRLVDHCVDTFRATRMRSRQTAVFRIDRATAIFGELDLVADERLQVSRRAEIDDVTGQAVFSEQPLILRHPDVGKAADRLRVADLDRRRERSGGRWGSR